MEMRLRDLARTFRAACRQRHKSGLALTVAFVVCACSGADDLPSGPVGTAVSGGRAESGVTTSGSGVVVFRGLVLSDEPHAAVIAREIMENGGNAADAATALYFGLAVAYPVAASLGGGGMCLVYDSVQQRVESIEFLPRSARAGGQIAVPGNVRGFGVLHARHGRLPWASLVAPAERLAANGSLPSRAFRARMAAAKQVVDANPSLRTTFTNVYGEMLQETDPLVQVELAATLALIRSRGAADFYNGDSARAFVSSVLGSGGKVTINDMRAYRPVTEPATQIGNRDRMVYLPSQEAGAGVFARAIWKEFEALEFEGAGADAAAREATRRVIRSFDVDPAILPADYGSTAFTVVSRSGDAVTCGVTMNGPFGAGSAGTGTGVVFASAPDAGPEGFASAFLTPVLVRNSRLNHLYFVAAASGSPHAVGATFRVLQQTLDDRRDLGDAISTAGRGPLDFVNAVVCSRGLPNYPQSCQFMVDPRGSGLGLEAIGAL